MPLFDVKVEVVTHQWYEVRAANAEEAAADWYKGSFMGSENVGGDKVLEVTELFDDDEEDTLAEEEIGDWEDTWEDSYGGGEDSFYPHTQR